jgi:predicted ATPase
VIKTTQGVDPLSVERVGQYLAAVVPRTEFAGVEQVGGYETLRFRVTPENGGETMEFDAANMSDGTLCAFATVMAAFQQTPEHNSPSLVAIEEPEAGLHPGAIRVLMAAMDEATLRTQILLTTHSPDLLDAEHVKPENIRVVEMIDGRTVISVVDDVDVSVVRDHLGTLGSLQRERRLRPEQSDIERQAGLARRNGAP